MPNAVNTNGAPQPVGPYSQAVVHGNMVITAGQIGIDPLTGELAEGIGAQTAQVLANLREVLLESGSGFDRILKINIYLASMEDFSIVNEVYSGEIQAPFPARSTVEVSGLPLGALVEIDAIAVLKEEQN